MHASIAVTLVDLYRQMLRARAFELAVAELWRRGLISGEMHLGTGEEAVAAGVVAHVRDGDALALTHRCSPALVVRGVPLVQLLREFLGAPDGLCGGRGGHMHVMSKEHLAAATGIVGASLPLGVGFALAAKHLRRGSIAVAFTGEGALNQGMVLESLNLAVVWSLPLLVVCIDNGWAITTRSANVTAGTPVERLRSFGWRVESVDGTRVEDVHAAAGALIDRGRSGRGPVALHARCPRLDGHFLGDPLVEQSHELGGTAARRTFGRVLAGFVEPGGGGPLARTASVARLVTTIARARAAASRDDTDDPLRVTERAIRDDEQRGIELEVNEEITAAVAAALAGGRDA